MSLPFVDPQAPGIHRGLNQTSDLIQVTYTELRKIAGAYLRLERSDHALQPTDLIHETYLQLVDQKRVQWQNQAHFVGTAAPY